MKVYLIPTATTIVLRLSYGPRCLRPITLEDFQNSSITRHNQAMELIIYMWPHILRSNKLYYFAFASSGKHWFPDDSNRVINGDHNDDNSDNYVDCNDENDVNFMMIMIQSGPRNLTGYLWKSC